MGVNWSGTRANPRLDLGAAVMEIMDSQEDFAGTKALPIFKTRLKESSYPAITRESIANDADLKRAKRSKYNRDGFEAEDKTFNCEEYGQEQPMDDSERRLYANDFAADLVATKIALGRVMRAQEKRINDLLLNTTTFTGASLYTDNSSAPWDTTSTDVLAQVSAAREKVRQNSGMRANALICGWSNVERLLLNDDLIAAIQPTRIPTWREKLAAIAAWLGVDHLIAGGAVRNSANQGIAFSGADIWNDDYVLVGRVVVNADDLSEPGLGRTFLWVEDSPENTVVEQYRDEEIRSDVFRVRQHVDEVLIDANFGHMLKVDA